jgi:hypothetical protein
VRTLRTLVDGGLTKLGVGTAADRKALADLIATPLGKDTSTVQATGHTAPAALPPKATPQQQANAMLEAVLGWSVVGVDEGPAAITKYLKDAAAVYNRRSLLATLKSKLGEDAKYLPTVKSVAAPKGLGAGALDVEIKIADLPASSLPANADPGVKGKISVSMHLLVMGDGETTWIAFGANRDELVKRLLAAKAGAADATLASRAGLEALKSGKLMSGGFMTIGSVTSSLPRILENAPAEAAEARKLADAIGRLPNRGSTPILMTGTVGVERDAARTDFQVNVSPGALQDIGALVLELAKGH